MQTKYFYQLIYLYIDIILYINTLTIYNFLYIVYALDNKWEKPIKFENAKDNLSQ